MKAFEEWWDKNRGIKYPPNHNYVSARAENLEHLRDKEVWKAALEWVLDQVEIDVVREELNNE